jgi:sensor histidine kinase YesM
MQLPYSGLYFILSGVTGIAVTHFYRLAIKEYRWFQLNILKLIRNMMIGALLVTIIYFIVLTLIDAMLFVFAFFLFKIEMSAPSISLDTYWAYFYLSMINVYAVFLLWSLLYFVFQYFENFQKAKYAQVLTQSQLKDATLLNLRNQINPHFLFNALNSIRSLILSDITLAREAVTLLSEILRYSLNSEQKKYVTLKEEFDVVRDYLELEKIRFGNRLHYYIHIDDECNDVQIPPLMVMTLAENAIKHGISQLKNGGEINLRANINQNKVEIMLSNNGILGQSAERSNSTGIGLNNTRQRLAMLYNNKASFNIVQQNADTVTASIQIPLSI